MNNLLIRCSSLGDIMTGAGKAVDDSVTCKRTLLKLYRQQKYKRYTELSNKYVEKGNDCEEDGITELNRYMAMMQIMPMDGSLVFHKNDQRLSNDFVTGEYDIAIVDKSGTIQETLDTKLSWSLDTLPHPKVDKLDAGYMWQGHGYMWLTGAKKHTVAHVLVNATPKLIDKAKKKLFWDSDAIDVDNDPDYIRKCQDIERNMIFDMGLFRHQHPNYILHTDLSAWSHDIPLTERVVLYPYLRSDEAIEAIKARVAECQQWVKTNFETNIE